MRLVLNKLKKKHTHTETQRNLMLGRKSLQFFPQLILVSLRPLLFPLLPYTCLLLGSACFGIPTKLPQLHSNRFWYVRLGASSIQKRTGIYSFFFYFEFSLIYFVRLHYKTVKKDFPVCKMIFFISMRQIQAERASLGMTATLRCVYICQRHVRHRHRYSDAIYLSFHASSLTA